MLHRPAMFLDIATACNPEMTALAPEPVVVAPSNYKDPEKIKEYVERETACRKAELIEKAALDPDYGKILSIGIGLADAPVYPEGKFPITVLVNKDLYGTGEDLSYPADACSEENLLRIFWKTFYEVNGRCIGYNVLGFDLPFLMRRSMALGVKPSITPMLAKYRTEPVTDLYGILYNWAPGKGLKQVARLYNIPNPLPDLDGSKVKDMDPETLRAYQRNDIQITAALYERMNGIYFDDGSR